MRKRRQPMREEMKRLNCEEGYIVGDDELSEREGGAVKKTLTAMIELIVLLTDFESVCFVLDS